METFPNLLTKTTTDRGEKLAIYDRGRELTYSQFRQRSLQLAAGLSRQGIGLGDRVAIWLPNCAAYLEYFAACAHMGATVISLNTKFRSSEIEDILHRSKSRALVFWPDFKGIDFQGILNEVPVDKLDALDLIVCYTESVNDKAKQPQIPGCQNVVLSDDLYEDEVMPSSVSTADTGLVVFTTSGTTGKPKFVLHTHKSITAHAIDVANRFGYAGRETRLLQVNPLCGTFGLTQAIAGFAGGGSVYCLPVFDAEAAAALIQEARITDINGSDDMYAMLLNARDEAIPYPSIINAGFAAFNPSLGNLVEDADRRGLKLVGLWGMSEVQAFTAHQLVADPVELRKQAGGYLLSDDAKIRVVDPETSAQLRFGDMGELEISCPGQMAEYLDNPDATAKTVTPDGYVKTGDLVIQHDERKFTFLSRMGDTLRLGGYLTDPVEIENVLNQYPGIAKSQVVGVDTDKGTKAFAFVVPRAAANLNKEDLEAHCRDHLASYKIPIDYFVLEDFPVTQSANGVKIQRARLREIAISHYQKTLA